MQIPFFWARASGDATSPEGKRLSLFAWGWSLTTRADAEQGARDRLARMVARVGKGEDLPKRYQYGERAIREERLEDLSGADGSTVMVVTRNRYGALVLNASAAMFIDVDLPPDEPGGLMSMFKKKTDPAEPVLASVRGALAALAPRSFRIYRTAAGFRVLALDREYQPASAETTDIMTKVGADPAYVQLCRAQTSFRARLTPKPWRCRHTTPPGDFPRDDPALQQRFEQWLTGYDAACAGHATCRFVEQLGQAPTAAAVAPVLALHDRLTLADSGLPLA